MNKELQDLAWSILPKEFKEEVKYEYRRVATKATKDEYDLGFMHAHEGMFGIHNLTSDAEGEDEMLTVPRKKVKEKWQRAYEQEEKYSRAQDSPVAREELYYNRGIMSIIDTLFGSKCLPNEVAVAENATTTESKPTEPKFKRGDKVIYKRTGKKKVVFGTDKYGRYCVVLPNMQSPMYVNESDIEPYTEPTDERTAEMSGPSESSDQFPDPTKMVGEHSNRDICDRLIQRGFRNHNRQHIAAMLCAGLLANPNTDKTYRRYQELCMNGEEVEKKENFVASKALHYADALIAKCKEGGNQ